MTPSWLVPLMLLLPIPAFASSPPLPESRFAAGDQAFRQRSSSERAREALAIYRSALRDHPEDAEAGWRLAMSCYFVGLNLETDASGKESLFAEGRDAGRRSAEQDPKCAACEFWTAIDMALYGNTVGSLKMLFSLGEIHQRLERSIALDPTYAEGGAFRLLGLIREKLPGLLGGSDRRARDYYEKAIHSAPEAPLNYLLMARLLKDRFGKLEESAEFVRLGALLPEPGVDRLENREAWTELRSWPSKTAP